MRKVHEFVLPNRHIPHWYAPLSYHALGYHAQQAHTALVRVWHWYWPCLEARAGLGVLPYLKHHYLQPC